jgi:hypothetical protein
MSTKYTKVEYSLMGGDRVVLPPQCREDMINIQVPEDIYATDTIQKYPLGAKLYKNNKIYRYVKFGAASTHVAMLKVNSNYDPGVTGHENEDGFEGALYAAVEEGDTYVDIADTNVRAENYYEDAELVLEYGTGGFIHQYRVISSEIGTGAYVRCHIGLPGAKSDCPVSGTAVDAYMSKYSDVKSAIDSSLNCDYMTAVGACGMAVTSGVYGWLQTGGPITLAGTAGVTTGHRMVYPNTDGSVLDAEHVAGGQEVGYVTGGTISGYGSLLVNLTLDT